MTDARAGWKTRAASGLFVALVISTLAAITACGSQTPTETGESANNPDASVGPGHIGLLCTPGTPGCPCSQSGQETGCGKVVDKNGSYVTCSMGRSTCDGSKWGACIGNRIVSQSLKGNSLQADGIHTESITGPCANVCDPNPMCTSITGQGSDVPDASGITVSEAGISLNGEGGTGSGCSGLGCTVSKCLMGAPTTISGTVTDPAGRNPLYNATVFVPVDPAGTLPAIKQGASCDTCAAEAAQPVVVTTTTGVDGKFTLSGVPDGHTIPIVVQMGKWRRELMLTSVNPCVANAVAGNCTATDPTMCAMHLPRNQYDGYNPTDGTYDHADIPQMAFAAGGWDPLACVLLKAGVDPSEFSSWDGKTPGSGGSVVRPNKRIHYYVSPENLIYNGGPPYVIATLSPLYGNNVSAGALWTAGADPAPSTPSAPYYDDYDAVFFACTGEYTDWQSYYSGKTPYKDLINYTNAGGRLFTTHHGDVWLERPQAYVAGDNWSNVASWYNVNKDNFVPSGQLSGTQNAAIVQTFPKGSAFASWLFNVGASKTLGTITLNEPRQDLTAVGPNSQPWMSTASITGPPTYPPHFTYNTPYNAAPSAQCGRVVY
ncbi:MAG: hypothetical protein ACREJ3_07295, partial [Polyangiaceae bacterium]